jgi:hypothetical protein
MQERPFPCGPGSDPYCPGSALDYDGWAGSKLFVQVAVFHPGNIPASASALLPAPPNEVPGAVIDAILALRLPQ